MNNKGLPSRVTLEKVLETLKTRLPGLTESRSLFGAGIAGRRQIDSGLGFPLCTHHRLQRILKLSHVRAITHQTMRLVLRIRDLPRPFPGSHTPGHVIIDRN